MANKTDLTRLYQSNATEWNAWRMQQPEIAPDLSDVDFQGMQLSAFNLGKANLTGANLSEATLSLTDLSEANLTGANLSQTDLCQADFTAANLSHANLSGANLLGANFSGANMEGAILSETRNHHLDVPSVAHKFQQWLDLYGEAAKSKQIIQPSAGEQAYQLFASRANGGNPTCGGASLIGPRAASAWQASQAWESTWPPSDNNNDAVEKLYRSPEDGVATILTIARRASGWNPQLPSTPQNDTKFFEYVRIVGTNPLLHLEYFDKTEYYKKEGDWDTVIKGIADLFQGVQKNDLDNIIKTLEGIAKAAMSYKDTRQATNIFAQQALKADSDTTRALIYSSSVEFIEHSGKSTTKQQTFAIARAQYRMINSLWTREAVRSLIKYAYSSLGTWVEEHTTKPGSIPNTPQRWAEVKDEAQELAARPTL